MKRAIQYCSSCNSNYNCVALVRKLGEWLGETLPTTREGEGCGEVYIICGYPPRYADCSRLMAERFLYLDRFENEEETHT